MEGGAPAPARWKRQYDAQRLAECTAQCLSRWTEERAELVRSQGACAAPERKMSDEEWISRVTTSFTRAVCASLDRAVGRARPHPRAAIGSRAFFSPEYLALGSECAASGARVRRAERSGDVSVGMKV